MACYQLACLQQLSLQWISRDIEKFTEIEVLDIITTHVLINKLI